MSRHAEFHAAKQAPALDAITIRRLAAEATVDVRSLQRRLRGETVRGMAGARCDQVLRANGFEPGQAAREARP